VVWILFYRYSSKLSLFIILRFKSPKEEEENRLLVSAIDCLWSLMNGNPEMEEKFMEKRGIFTLLDLLEREETQYQSPGLTFFLDLLKNQKVHAHALIWRSKKDSKKTVAQLLLSIWSQEEKKLGGNSFKVDKISGS
jgi:hypothetical protein